MSKKPSNSGSGADFAFDTETLKESAATALKRAEGRSKSYDPFADLSAKLDGALSKTGDIKAGEFKLGEIRDNIDEVLNDATSDTNDLAEVFLSLQDLTKQLGAGFDDLEGMHPEAAKIMTDAADGLTAAGAAISASEIEKGIAEGKIVNLFFFKLGSSRLAAAVADLNAANERLKAAQEASVKAPALADAKHREMIQSADMEAVSGYIRAMHEKANSLVEARLEKATESLARRNSVIAVARQRLASTTTEFHDSKEAWETQCKVVQGLHEERDTGTLERNTPEFTELEGRISIAEQKAGELKSRMDASMGESQELQEKLQAFEMQRDALITLKGNYERTLRVGKVSAKSNQEITNIRVELLKGLSDLSVQNELNAVSRRDSLDAAEGAASLYNAVERARVQYGKDHPEIMRRFSELRSKLDRKIEFISEEDRQLEADWRERLNGKASPPSPSGQPTSIEPEAVFQF